jgi:translation initiation factor IF-1
MERARMAKEELMELDGEITELLPEGRFRVRLDNDHVILAYTAGRMKRNRIKSLVGDRVTVEMTPYDLDKGRITFRHKTEAARVGGAPRRPQFKRR